MFANTTATTEFLPNDLPEFLAGHPDVNIELRERLSHDIVRAVSEGLADIGIVAGSTRLESLETRPYRSDRVVLAVACAHPLAQQDSVWFRDVTQFPFVSLPEASAIHTFLLRVAQDLHAKLQVRIEVGSFDALCRMIEANVGIGVLPHSSAVRCAKSMGIRLLRIEDDWAARNLLICARSFDLLPSFARELVELLTQKCESELSVQ
jgi:DNA-binding transcriptional LysR family regulator